MTFHDSLRGQSFVPALPIDQRCRSISVVNRIKGRIKKVLITPLTFQRGRFSINPQSTQRHRCRFYRTDNYQPTLRSSRGHDDRENSRVPPQRAQLLNGPNCSTGPIAQRAQLLNGPNCSTGPIAPAILIGCAGAERKGNHQVVDREWLGRCE
ncbi:hypothetical protein CA13_04740 [Planctomycetes bacterium CA13]|uniref:Uncharacterized protein n=1 Tax=Novipirellula herctigrandis TaxID=2527986 RepID=A0A5C5YX05_9BACT|nr:hypothetical protein CA13_04740 [Planctomycetes bacterium CA13]